MLIIKLLSNVSFLLSIFLCVTVSAYADQQIEQIRVLDQRKPDDASHKYYVELLELVLDASAPEYGPARLLFFKYPTHERSMRMLASGGELDVAWGGDSRWRSANLLKVDFPLMKGGLGWRGMVVRKEDQPKISSFRSVADFNRERLVACQGLNWPDVTYLRSAGFKVLEVRSLDSMMNMVGNQRCDFLPLSVYEGQTEVQSVSHRFKNLTFIYEPILRYPLKMYFFVNVDKPKLSGRLLSGLLIIQASGEFDRFIRQHPLTQHAFPLSRFQHFIEIANPEKESQK